MPLLSNVRTKIWACVSVALFSYLVATLSTTIVNHRTQASISHVLDTDLPLATKAIQVHSLFTAQSEDYENGLLTGEKERVAQGNERHGEISRLLAELVKVAAASHTSVYPATLALRDNYHDYYTLASNYYMEAVLKDDLFASRREVYQLGMMRVRLASQFEETSSLMQEMTTMDLAKNNENLKRSTLFLHILFILFLFVTTLVINWLANREIITPLERIKKMITAFRHGQDVEQPATPSGQDEIRSLAFSFWQMTRDLGHLSASHDYVNNIIDNMSDSLIILQPDLTIKAINKATLVLLASQEKPLLGQHLATIFNEPDSQLSRSLLRSLQEGDSVNNVELSYRNQKGQAKPVLFSASGLYTAEGSLQGISCLAHDMDELKQKRGQHHFMSNFDELTGLAGRQLFLDRLQTALHMAQRYKHTVALLSLRLKRFDELDKVLGRGAQDQLLQEIGQRLHQVARDSDSVARLATDQFAILLSKVGNEEDARLVATKVLETLSQPVLIMGSSWKSDCSIGICLSTPESGEAEELLSRATTASQAAQVEENKQIVVYAPD